MPIGESSQILSNNAWTAASLRTRSRRRLVASIAAGSRSRSAAHAMASQRALISCDSPPFSVRRSVSAWALDAFPPSDALNVKLCTHMTHSIAARGRTPLASEHKKAMCVCVCSALRWAQGVALTEMCTAHAKDKSLLQRTNGLLGDRHLGFDPWCHSGPQYQ